MDETNPTARALRCLLMLQDAPGIGGDELAERLGVSPRAARRYVAILREAGVPVESIRGPYGGYRLGRGRRTPLVFSTAEALGLVMAVLEGHRDTGDPEDPVGTALGKLLRTLPDAVAGQADQLRRGTRAAPDRGAASPDPGLTTALVRAGSRRRRVEVDYTTEGGSSWSVAVDPWAVVVRHGRWYLLCWSHHAGAVRTLRVDRIAAVREREERFAPPADLDPVAVLESALGQGWEHEVSVRIHAPAERARRWLSPVLGRLAPDGEDACLLTGTTGNPFMVVEHLACLPVAFEVLGGPELREAAQRVGRRLLEASAQR